MPYDIKPKGTQFQLVLKRTGKVLGTHATKAEAQSQIGAIEASKARRGK
jgi:hypothetical protein